MQDILGKILEAKKGQSMTITINVEPEHETQEEALKKQGMAPELKGEEKAEPEEDIGAAIMNGEEDEIALKKKRGIAPKGLSDRVKMAMND